MGNKQKENCLKEINRAKEKEVRRDKIRVWCWQAFFAFICLFVRCGLLQFAFILYREKSGARGFKYRYVHVGKLLRSRRKRRKNQKKTGGKNE